MDPAELLGEGAEILPPTETPGPVQADAPAVSEPATQPSTRQAPATPRPEDAAAAEQLLESRGAVMDPAQLDALLHERLVWVTATGKSVSRSSVLQYRERAFTQQGAPAKQGVQQIDASSVLVMAAVATARGRVSRSSIWHYDAERGLWRLRFRQETPAS